MERKRQNEKDNYLHRLCWYTYWFDLIGKLVLFIYLSRKRMVKEQALLTLTLVSNSILCSDSCLWNWIGVSWSERKERRVRWVGFVLLCHNNELCDWVSEWVSSGRQFDFFINSILKKVHTYLGIFFCICETKVQYKYKTGHLFFS